MALQMRLEFKERNKNRSGLGLGIRKYNKFHFVGKGFCLGEDKSFDSNQDSACSGNTSLKHNQNHI